METLGDDGSDGEGSQASAAPTDTPIAGGGAPNPEFEAGGSVAAAGSLKIADSSAPTRSDAGPSTEATGRCAEERRLADERCQLATVARARADEAAGALRGAQRAHDAHEAAAVTASARADARAAHDAKDAAQAAFRETVAHAGSREDLESAARDWLGEINRINIEAREAAQHSTREHAAAMAAAESLERLTLEADAARISAENADALCVAARTVVAECDELAATAASVPAAVGPVPMAGARLDDDETLEVALLEGGEPMIFRLLHGDRGAMTGLVATLGGDDPEARRRWQLQLTGLLEAIVADAIEATALEFPEEHPFWSGFGRGQAREIATALASLGFRFDGLGGWADGRQPTQRDLAMALGYAGLDPKRIRHWPKEDVVAAMFNDVTVAADEYLAGVAGDLTLPEMVAMLGRRADPLADLWNNWGSIRPMLLAES